MKDTTVKNESIIDFLSWAVKQPKGYNKVVLTMEEVSEPNGRN